MHTAVRLMTPSEFRISLSFRRQWRHGRDICRQRLIRFHLELPVGRHCVQVADVLGNRLVPVRTLSEPNFRQAGVCTVGGRTIDRVRLHVNANGKERAVSDWPQWWCSLLEAGVQVCQHGLGDACAGFRVVDADCRTTVTAAAHRQ